MPQNSRSTQRARHLRRDSTMPERLLWARLRNHRLAGLKFRRQHPVGPFIVDFYCHAHQLVIEIDGLSHVGMKQHDEQRTAYLKQQGLQVIRFTNDDVLRDADAVAETIVQTIRSLRQNPHPNPLPEGA